AGRCHTCTGGNHGKIAKGWRRQRDVLSRRLGRWHMWVPEVSVADRLVRAVVGYLFLLVLFRIAGKRQVGQLTPFDLGVLMLVSNVMQNAMIGPDNSVGGGMIGVGAIIVLNGLIAFAASRNRRLERLVEGSPTLLVHDGVVDIAALRRELLT